MGGHVFAKLPSARPRRPSRLSTSKVLSASHTMRKGRHWILPHSWRGMPCFETRSGELDARNFQDIQDSGLIGDTNRVRGITTWNRRSESIISPARRSFLEWPLGEESSHRCEDTAKETRRTESPDSIISNNWAQDLSSGLLPSHFLLSFQQINLVGNEIHDSSGTEARIPLKFQNQENTK